MLLCIICAGRPAGARAHVISKRSCDVVWQQSIVDKFRLKQQCLKAAKRHAMMHLCSRPLPLAPPSVRVKGSVGSAAQRRVITIALNEARRQGATLNVRIALVMALTQESSASELSGGHGTSVGPLQLINLHGTPAQRKSTLFSTRWFLSGVLRSRFAGKTPGQIADDQQRPARRGLYDKWEPEARHTVRLFMRGCKR